MVTAYLASLCRRALVVQPATAEVTLRALVTGGAAARLRAALRRGALGDARPLACALLSLGRLDPAAAQLALDMLWRLKGYEVAFDIHSYVKTVYPTYSGESIVTVDVTLFRFEEFKCCDLVILDFPRCQNTINIYVFNFYLFILVS